MSDKEAIISKQPAEILVLSGGGVKGISLIGSISALEEKGLLENITTYAGTSIGGIVGCMILIGYTGKELFDYVIQYNLENIMNIDLANLINDYCVDNGKMLEKFLEELIKNKGIDPNISLLELYKKTEKRLIVTTVCLNDPSRAIYLWYATHPTLPLITALRMTSALMPYYSSVIYEGKLYGDGGYIDNYPMRIFRNKLDKVIGLFIMEDITFMNTDDINKDIICYIARLFKCFQRGININCIKGFEKYSHIINVNGVSAISYGISADVKKELYDVGYNSIKIK